MGNNFILTFGKQPYNYINRFDYLNEIVESFDNVEPTEQSIIITGVRGSGKTVMLTVVTDYFDNKSDWIVVDLNPNNDLTEELISKLYQNTKTKSLFRKIDFGVSFQGFNLNIENDKPELSGDCIVEKMVEKLSKDKKILITIDEATNTSSMKSFAHLFQSLIRKDYPIFLLMTGLYENINEIQNNKTSTFLLRSKKLFLNSLDMTSITHSYKNIFDITIADASKLAKLTCGYAFAYQLLGYLLQRNNKKIADNDILIQYDEYLCQYVYEKLWNELTGVEKNILKQIKTQESIKINELIKRCNSNSSYINLYKDRLIKKGIIFSPAYGHICFSLPRFKEFIDIKSFD